MTTLTVTAQVLTAGEGDAVGVMVRSDADSLDTVAAGILAAHALRLWEQEHAVSRYRIRDLVWKEEAESSSAIYDLADTDADAVTVPDTDADEPNRWESAGTVDGDFFTKSGGFLHGYRDTL